MSQKAKYTKTRRVRIRKKKNGRSKGFRKRKG